MFLTRRFSAIFGERRTSRRILLAITSNRSCRHSAQKKRGTEGGGGGVWSCLLLNQIEDILEVVAAPGPGVAVLLSIFRSVDFAQLIWLNFQIGFEGFIELRKEGRGGEGGCEGHGDIGGSPVGGAYECKPSTLGAMGQDPTKTSSWSRCDSSLALTELASQTMAV
jgi:hypothetical protein